MRKKECVLLLDAGFCLVLREEEVSIPKHDATSSVALR